jgi:hypothetical protein
MSGNDGKGNWGSSNPGNSGISGGSSGGGNLPITRRPPLDFFLIGKSPKEKAEFLEYAKQVNYSNREIQSWLDERYGIHYPVAEIHTYLKQNAPLSYKVDYLNQLADEATGLNVEACNKLLQMKLIELLLAVLDNVIAAVNVNPQGSEGGEYDEDIERLSTLEQSRMLRVLLQESSRLSSYLSKESRIRVTTDLALGGAQEVINIVNSIFRESPYEKPLSDGFEYALQKIERDISKIA